MKLRRILTDAAIDAAIGVTAAIAFRSFVIGELPWDYNWDADGGFIRFIIAWSACAGAMFGAIFPRGDGGRA
jgi:hypothetical protein